MAAQSRPILRRYPTNEKTTEWTRVHPHPLGTQENHQGSHGHGCRQNLPLPHSTSRTHPKQQMFHLPQSRMFHRNHPGARNRTPNRTYLPRNQRPHSIRNTDTTPVPPTKPIDEVESYLNVIRSNRNLSNQDVLKSLQILFDDSIDEQGEQINTIRLDQEIPKTDF